MTQPARILVVDDEEGITDLVATALRYEGYEAAVAADGRAALSAVAAFRPHLVVLDVLLPDLDGYEVARRLDRDGHDVPVLFLSALDATEDRVRGLSVGGDDYVTKPFSLEELVLRVRAILRRAGAGHHRRLRFADLELDDDTHEVWRGDTAIELTATEHRLLAHLLANARRVQSKAVLLDRVWGPDVAGDPNLVETYVSYLRKKLDPLGPPLIHTVRGVGYVLRLPKG